LIGEASCIEEGNDEIETDDTKSYFCSRMLPDACYQSRISIERETNWQNCAWAFFQLKVIELMYSDIEAAAVLVEDFFGTGCVTNRFLEASPSYPSVIVANYKGASYVFLTGTTNYLQAATQGLYQGTGPTNQGEYSCSQVYENAARYTLNRLSTVGGISLATFKLCGHSYGGAIAYVMACKLRIADRSRRIEFTTFGMPKPGDQRLIDIGNEIRGYHYVSENDPVPFLPPQGITWDFIRVLLLPLIWLSWSQYVRPSRVMVIREDGSLEPTSSETIDDSILRTVITAVNAGSSMPSFKEHAVEWYKYRIAESCPCVLEVVPRPYEPPPPPPHNLLRGFRVELTGFVWHTPQGNITWDFVADLVYKPNVSEWGEAYPPSDPYMFLETQFDFDETRRRCDFTIYTFQIALGYLQLSTEDIEIDPHGTVEIPFPIYDRFWLNDFPRQYDYGTIISAGIFRITCLYSDP